MKKTKLGTFFLVSILALAGIGISYSGFMDSISIYGTVDTATVKLSIEDFSGTDVWKVWMDQGSPPVPYDNEVFIWHGFKDDKPSVSDVLGFTGADHAEIVASAWGKPGSTHGSIDYDVDMIWDNIFPCIDFTADVIIKYTGSIPAKINLPIPVWHEGGDVLSKFLEISAFEVSKINDEWFFGYEIIDWPYQIHFGEYVAFNVKIHIDQNNNLQGKHGEFSFNIDVVQWNDECEKVNIPPVAIANGPYSGYIGDTITFDGSSSYDLDGVIVLYEWDFDCDGIYDYSSSTTGIAYYSYAMAGVYTAKLRVTDDKISSNVDTALVTIDEPQATVSFVSSKDIVQVGEDFTVDIVINPLLEIGGWEIYELVFSSGLIEVNDVVPGSFWASFFDPGLIDNLAGFITCIQTWSMGPYPDMTHVACTLYCSAVDIGFCIFDINDMDIADSDGTLLTGIMINSDIVKIII